MTQAASRRSRALILSSPIALFAFILLNSIKQLYSDFNRVFSALFVTETWCQKTTKPNFTTFTIMPATGSSADSSPSVGQENAAAPVMLPHAIQSNLPVPSRLDTRGNIAENWKRWKQVWDSFEIAFRLNQQEN